jgi:hypothetical protein
MTSTMTAVVCTECRHENEAERVYCHGCGARLDRSALKKPKENPQDAQKRVKAMFDPQRERIRALFFKVSKVLLGACGAAALVQMALPPDVPAPAKTAIIGSQIRLDLEGAATRHQPSQLQYTDEQITGFLGYALKPKQKSLDQPLLDFNRALVTFREGECDITAQRSLFGYSLYTTIYIAPTIDGGKMVATNKGGRIGRLPVHPQVAQFMTILFADVSKAMERELKLVSKLGTIQFHDKTVLLTAAR